MLAVTEQSSWWLRAACRGEGPGPWFSRDRAAVDYARWLCSTCPVRAECLADALATEERWTLPSMGIFGGLSARERDALRRPTSRRTWAAARQRRDPT